MPKDRRINSLSSDRSMSSPYTCSSNNDDHGISHFLRESAEDVKIRDNIRCPPHSKAADLQSSLASVEDVKEWEEVRCSICMEHPHNAVLLKCSSFEKGCRPYMCNTSYRHSNCLDKFCKSSVSCPSTAVIDDEIRSSRATPYRTREGSPLLQAEELSHVDSDDQTKLFCPLCRGDIYGWVVVLAARQFMNSKERACSCETCDFVGNYSLLRKHARTEHPFTRPSEVDPQSQLDWANFVYERDIEDLRAMIREPVTEEVPGTEFHGLLDMTQQDDEEGNGVVLSDFLDSDWWTDIVLQFFHLLSDNPVVGYDTEAGIYGGGESSRQNNRVRSSFWERNDQRNSSGRRLMSRLDDIDRRIQMERTSGWLTNTSRGLHMENHSRWNRNFQNNLPDGRNNYTERRRSHNRPSQTAFPPYFDR